MKLRTWMRWSSALCLGACALQAQETKSLEDVQKQLQQMQDNFNKVVQEQQKKIEELNRQGQDLKKAQVAPPTNAPMVAATTNAPPGAASATNAVGQIAGATPPVPEKKPWSP